MPDDQNSSVSMSPAADELYDRPSELIPGRDDPVVVLSVQERDDIAEILMTLEHRVRSLGDTRAIEDLVKQSAEGPAVGRLIVELATGFVGLDAASRMIVEVLALRLLDSADAREKANGAILGQALSDLLRDPLSYH